MNDKNEKLLEEVNYLIDVCGITMKQVAKRLKINYQRLLRIKSSNILDPELAFQKYKPRRRFRKLHQRARDRIKKMIVDAAKPLQIADIQSVLWREMNLKISHTMLQRYLTQELNVSYRKLRPVSQNYNNLNSKLQR